MAKHLIQLVIAGTYVVGRAFATALRQEIAASNAAAMRAGGGTKGEKHSAINLKLGLSLDEAKQILDINELDKEQIKTKYDYLFKINEKVNNGGSFYIQSKVVRAKERIDQELANVHELKEEKEDPKT